MCRQVLVTGAGSGIGRAVAVKLTSTETRVMRLGAVFAHGLSAGLNPVKAAKLASVGAASVVASKGGQQAGSIKDDELGGANIGYPVVGEVGEFLSRLQNEACHCSGHLFIALGR